MQDSCKISCVLQDFLVQAKFLQEACHSITIGDPTWVSVTWLVETRRVPSEQSLRSAPTVRVLNTTTITYTTATGKEQHSQVCVLRLRGYLHGLTMKSVSNCLYRGLSLYWGSGLRSKGIRWINPLCYQGTGSTLYFIVEKVSAAKLFTFESLLGFKSSKLTSFHIYSKTLFIL